MRLNCSLIDLSKKFYGMTNLILIKEQLTETTSRIIKKPQE